MPARRAVPPDAPPTPLEQRGKALGIGFSRGRTVSAYSRLALEAAEFAFEHGDEWRFHRRVFRAYFEDLEDIGDVETLLRLGADAGLDGSALRAALLDRRYQAQVDEGIAWSRAIGVTAIPTFIFDGRFALVGAHELDAFREIMAKVAEPPKR